MHPNKKMLQIQHNKIQKTLQILSTQPNTENAANTLIATKYRKRCKYSTQPNTENAANTLNATKPNTENVANILNATKYRKHCKYSQRNQIQKTLQILSTQPNTKNAANTLNVTKYRNTLQILTTSAVKQIIVINRIQNKFFFT
ncbi:MAG: hypothetical protein ACRCVN_04680 [Spirochaetia bacterium]